jgi:hypothetical protein
MDIGVPYTVYIPTRVVYVLPEKFAAIDELNKQSREIFGLLFFPEHT